MSNPRAHAHGLALATNEPQSLDEMALADLREYRNALKEQEARVSYWRRLIQFRLDLIEEEKKSERVATRDLLRSLGGVVSGARRNQFLSVNAEAELPELPGLEGLWTSATDPNDTAANEALVAELNRVERTLSEYRRMLFDRIDAATAELIARYRDNPKLALDLIPAEHR